MTCLVLPSATLRGGLEATLDDFGAVEQMHGSGFWHLGPGVRPDTSTPALPGLVRMLRGYADPRTELPAGLVHSDYWWITDAEPDRVHTREDGSADPGQVIGFLAIRHRLNDWLLEEGGHVGYSVRPARRREGHATRALRLAVARSAALGIESVLVTCDADNLASRGTIEAAGGVFEDQRQDKLRFWISTSA